MPVIEPAVSLRNFTPTSVAEASGSAATPGVAVLDQILHVDVPVVPDPMVTDVPADGVSRLPLSSTARLLIVVEPPHAPAVHEYVQLPRPVATCQVVPPSVETSTPPTTPPVSVAVPLIVTLLPGATVVPEAGDVIVDVGAPGSVGIVAAVSPLWG